MNICLLSLHKATPLLFACLSKKELFGKCAKYSKVLHKRYRWPHIIPNIFVNYSLANKEKPAKSSILEIQVLTAGL